MNKDVRQVDVRHPEVRVQLERLFESPHRVVVTPGEVQELPLERVGDQRNGVKFSRSLRLLDGLIMPPNVRQQLSIAPVGVGVIGVKVNGTSEFAFGPKDRKSTRLN